MLSEIIRNHKWYSLILSLSNSNSKILRIYNFIKNILHHGSLFCNFVKFSEFLENLWAGLGYIVQTLGYVIHPLHPIKSKQGTKFRSLTNN